MASERAARFAVRTVFALLLGAAPLSFTLDARAQEPSAADKETARGLMDEGHARRDRHDLKGALESFQAADAIMHVPTTALEVARSAVALGMLVEARDKLLELQRIAQRPNEPRAFAEARTNAQSMSDDLEVRIPAIHLVLRGVPEGSPPSVAIDGATIPPAALIAWRKLNPGHHEIVAHASTAERREEVTLHERDKKEVIIDFTGTAAAPVAPPSGAPAADTSTQPPPPPPDSGKEAEPKSNPWKIITFVGFGVGGAGIVVGSITGLMSISSTNSAKSQCVNNLCPPSASDDISSAKTTGTISTVAFVVGGVGVAAGVLGLVLGHSSSASASSSTAAFHAGTVRAEPWVGPGSLGLRGTF